MSKKRILALIMASVLAMSSAGETAVVFGSDFTDVEIFDDSISEAEEPEVLETEEVETVPEDVEVVPEDVELVFEEETEDVEIVEEPEIEEVVEEPEVVEAAAEPAIFTSGDSGEDVLFSSGEGEAIPDGRETYGFEGLRGTDGNYTWVFAGEEHELSLWVSEELDENVEFVWETGWSDDEGNFTKTEVDGLLTVDPENDRRVVINGDVAVDAARAGDLGPREYHFLIRALAYVDGTAIYDYGTTVLVQEDVYDYHFPSWGESMLPHWDFWIDREFNCYVENAQNPYGEDMPVLIESLTVEVKEGDDNAVERYEEEHGYNLHMNSYGMATVTIQYYLLDGSGELAEHSFDIWVGGDVYRIDMWSTTDTNRLLPGNSLDIQTNVTWERFDEENGHYQGEPNVIVKWAVTDGAEHITLTEDPENDRNVTVTANADVEDCGANVQAIVYLLDEEGNIQKDDEGNDIEVTRGDYWIEIYSAYHQIYPHVKDADGNDFNLYDLFPGDSVEFAPELVVFYSENKEGETVQEDVSYRFWFDTEAIEIKDAEGNVVLQDERAVGPFTVTKLRNYETEITMAADISYEDGNTDHHVAEYRFRVGHTWFDIFWQDEIGNIRDWGRPGGPATWVFNNEEVTLQINADSMGDTEGLRLEWATDYTDEDDNHYEGNPDSYTVSEDGTQITLHGDKIWESGQWIGITPRVMYGDYCVGETDRIHVESREIVYDYHYPSWGQSMLPHWDWEFDKVFNCYVEDPMFPWGNDVEVIIENVEFELVEEESEENALELIDEGERWRIHANGFGHAVVTIYYAPLGDSENSGVHTFDVWSGGDVYGMDLWSHTDSDMLLPGNSLTLQAEPTLECFDEDRGHYQGDTSDITVEWTIECGEEFIDYEIDGKYAHIQAKDDIDGGEVHVEVRAFLTDENGNIRVDDEGNRMEVAYNDTWLHITNGGYHQLFMAVKDADGNETSVENLAVGNSAILEPELKFFDMDNMEGIKENREVVYFVEFDPQAIEIKDADGNVIESGQTADAPFTVTRLKNWNQEINVVATILDGENTIERVCEYRLHVWEQDYSFWFADMRDNEEWTWIYNDEELRLPIDMSNIGDKPVEFEWHVGVAGEDSFTSLDDVEGLLKVDAEDPTVAVLDGSVAYANREQFRGEEYFNVIVVACANGEPVYDYAANIHLREPVFETQMGNINAVIGRDYFYRFINNGIPVYVENSEYPWGGRIRCTINKIESSDETVFKPYFSKDDKWGCAPLTPGKADITIYYLVGEEERAATFTWTAVVKDYGFDFWCDDAENIILPGSEKQLHLDVSYMDATGKHILDPDEYTVEYISLNEDLISVSPAGLITAADVEEPAEAWFKAIITIPCEGEDDVVLEQDFIIYIRDYFHGIAFDREVVAAPGEVLTIEDFAPVTKLYVPEHPAGKVPANPEYTFIALADTDNSWVEVSEDGKSLKITAEKMEVADETESTGVLLRAEYTHENGEEDWAETWITFTICKHDFETEVTEEPDCKETGIKTHTCKKCDTVEEEVLPIIPHDWDEPEVAVEPTCTQTGLKTADCKICGDTKNVETIPATGHDWSEWEEISPATVTAKAVEESVCYECDATRTQTVGSVLTPFATPQAKKVTMKKSTTIKKFAVELANGDYISSVKSSKTSVATVKKNSDGTLTIAAKKKTGKATLTITPKYAKKFTITVTVQDDKVTTTKISGVPKKKTLAKGSKLNLKELVKVTPFNTSDKTTYSTSDKKVATVSKTGVVTAKNPGTAKITVKSGSKTAICTVTVPGITNVPKSVTLKKKGSITLNPKKFGISGKVTYSSSKTSVATVSKKGKITAKKKAGTATITVKAGKYKVTCKVKVK